MPTVAVYVRAEDWRRLEGDGENPVEWVRELVRNSLALRGTPSPVADMIARPEGAPKFKPDFKS